jgi:hypothetical protein
MPKTVLCVPGKWKSMAELESHIARYSGGYKFEGANLSEGEELVLELEVCPRDGRMMNSFRAAGPHWAGTAEMERIQEHEMVLYLVGEGGSPDRATAFIKAGAGLIHAGGLGVKVESAGLAFSPVEWLQLANGIFTEHRGFVVYVTGQETYSCGMHNPGMRDAVVNSDEAADPVELLREFTRFLFIEKPMLAVGHTFSVAKDAPRYRLVEEVCEFYEPDHLFTNPYGIWRLNLIT